MRKLKIAVLFGGCSPEHEISLQSAYGVITHVDAEKYEPVLIGVTREGEWFYFTGAPEKIRDDTWNNPADCAAAVVSPCRKTRGVLVFENDSVRVIKLDAAFPVLHGKNGEDGTVQGLLELAGIPVAGCGALSSALCMDKERAHRLAEAAGIRVPKSFTVNKESGSNEYFNPANDLGYPLFVKPVKAGSSFGVTKIFNESELPAAAKLAFEYDYEIIIEENIPGFEIGCAVLGGENPAVGVLDEVELACGFFNYNEKYTPDTSIIHVPARISKEKMLEAKETAIKIYRALGCRGFARVDMFFTPSGEIIFNEVNTIPGFTAHSRFPNMLAAAGMTFKQIVNGIIDLAVR